MSLWPERAVNSAYIHIPFCVRKCTYCDFLSFADSDPQHHRMYAQALKQEIIHTADLYHTQRAGDRILQTIYLGGGTPSLLSVNDYASLFDQLQLSFGVDQNAECTLEANPGTVTREKLAGYRSLGFNRISYGVQAVQPHLLKLMGRIHDAAAARKSIEQAYQAGFENISVDILFGLPEQSMTDVHETLKFVLSCPVTHVSYYGLILEEGTPLAKESQLGRLSLPDDRMEREQYHLIRHVLASNGFQQYEISSSAQKGFACRHHLTYWRGLPYHGIGCGAHRFLNGWRGHNTEDLNQYMNAYLSQQYKQNSGHFPTYGEHPELPTARWLESIDQSEAMREMMMLGFRLTTGIFDDDFKKRFGCSYHDQFNDELNQLSQQDLIIMNSDSVRLSTRGLDFANDVFRQFV